MQILLFRVVRLSALFAVATLVGCTSVDFTHQLTLTQQQTRDLIGTRNSLTLIQSKAQRQAIQERVQQIVAQPLTQDAAVELALINSPALQLLLAQSWAQSEEAAQNAQLANPLFAFSHVRVGSQLDIERSLSIGVLDLLTLPQRSAMVKQGIEQNQLRLSASVVNFVTEVRQAWIRAVAARQALSYANQIEDSSQAVAELAKRLHAAGNWNRLQSGVQQAFALEAAQQLSQAQLNASTSFEMLAKLLGVTHLQAAQLTLPQRLPDLPQVVEAKQAVQARAEALNLTVALAQSRLEQAAQAQNLTWANTLGEIELGGRRDTQFDSTQASQSGQGYTFALRLPILNWNTSQRTAMNARTLAAAAEFEAAVHTTEAELNTRYATYQSQYQIAQRYRDELIPLYQTLSDDMLRRYNGMLTGVFELVANTRERIQIVLASLSAERDFWLAETSLQAAVLGTPNTNLQISNKE